MSYPECEKMAKVRGLSQQMGEFLEWIQHEKKFHFARYEMRSIFPEWSSGWDEMRDSYKKLGRKIPELEYLIEYPIEIEKLLAEYFKIDLNKVEHEKRAMLEVCRKANEK